MYGTRTVCAYVKLFLNTGIVKLPVPVVRVIVDAMFFFIWKWYPLFLRVNWVWVVLEHQRFVFFMPSTDLYHLRSAQCCVVACFNVCIKGVCFGRKSFKEIITKLTKMMTQHSRTPPTRDLLRCVYSNSTDGVPWPTLIAEVIYIYSS